MIKELLLIAVIVVFILDLSGFVEQIKRKAFKVLFPKKQYTGFSLKPFDCSLCTTWWIGLIWIHFNGGLNLSNIALLALICFFTETINDLLIFGKDAIGMALNKLYKILK